MRRSRSASSGPSAIPPTSGRAGEIIAELYPDLFVTLSCDVYPRIREYERMNTAVLNAFVSAGAETYIGKLTEGGRARACAGADQLHAVARRPHHGARRWASRSS